VLVENRSGDFSMPILDPLRRTPIAAALLYTRRRWYTMDPAIAPDLDRLQASIDGDIGDFNLSNDRGNWVVYAEPVGKPGRYFHYRRNEHKTVPLFSTRVALDDAALVKLEPVVIPTRGDLRLVGYLSRGVGIEAGQPGPMVLLVHDGPATRDMPDFNGMHQWLANRGYHVLSVNFRGSTGLGKKTAVEGDGEWADKMQNDLLDAVEWANNERLSNELRVAICGAGYGGFASLIGACLTPDRFACAIDLGGMTNLVAFADQIPPYWKPSMPGLKVRLGADGSSDAGRKFLASRSPLTYVDRIRCPLLIAHGANDVRVPIAQSDEFVAAMQTRKLPVTYVTYKDEGHVFRRPENRLSFAAVAEAFLAQNIGGRAEPVGDAFTGSSIEFRTGRELIKGLG
jgi:dipeptidyl aminopeptidase/acylaminoacyl peptidase